MGVNNLTSTIPSTLWRLKDIQLLELSSNYLSGSLPLDISNLKVVRYLDISGNQLSGEIPSSIGDLKDLAHLSLSNNRLQGPISPSFGGMGKYLVEDHLKSSQLDPFWGMKHCVVLLRCKSSHVRLEVASDRRKQVEMYLSTFYQRLEL
ncbi:LRR RECEPTOR-LIKE SERINE/THREONINE-PROTEIN KINASE EFR ISOFORM X1 [Salix koriyanagi]|uniref:LRR RECEPTOR-LIKE SERINE/THREONINE-PROTEIN KINASE EFR ISOFORM X1 n=1 Tax=Salix koriyanagi TaxID=2511006 RepID=A0A9Q0UDA9_9ROSI|nr:LRR RECEPTOR-LIKE SERINE/THREONINE-PROTEIN KINASE EFR ISOFORM X1 [Salix koriyanagi]